MLATPNRLLSSDLKARPTRTVRMPAEMIRLPIIGAALYVRRHGVRQYDSDLAFNVNLVFHHRDGRQAATKFSPKGVRAYAASNVVERRKPRGSR